MRWFAESLLRYLDEGRRFVCATVVGHSGSAPRHAGARMFVFEDGSIEGSVGGGALEHRVVQAALELFERGGSVLLEFDLGRDLKMACGGSTKVFLELVLPGDRVVILGAGHIGRALARFVSLLGLEAWVADGRPGFAVAEHFPEGVRLVGRLDPETVVQDLKLVDRAGRTYVVIATHSHALDFQLAERVLRDTSIPYVGMVASRKKVAGFRKAAEAKGVPPERLAVLHSPVGLPLGGQSPAEIALSIVSEIQAHRHGRRLTLAEEREAEPAGETVVGERNR